jgi:hypothetical protein
MLHKIKKVNVHKAPVPYIIINQPIDMSEYDKLYEQWNNPSHNVWQIFLEKSKVEVVLKNKLNSSAHRNQKEFVGYWFFQQRTDRRSVHIELGEKKIEYKSNCLLIIDSEKQFSVINKGAKLPDLLNCVVYFNPNQQNKIKEFLSL